MGWLADKRAQRRANATELARIVMENKIRGFLEPGETLIMVAEVWRGPMRDRDRACRAFLTDRSILLLDKAGLRMLEAGLTPDWIRKCSGSAQLMLSDFSEATTHMAPEEKMRGIPEIGIRGCLPICLALQDAEDPDEVVPLYFEFPNPIFKTTVSCIIKMRREGRQDVLEWVASGNPQPLGSREP